MQLAAPNSKLATDMQPSHRYEFSRAAAVRLAGLPLLPVLLFAAVMHLGAVLHLLPPPQAALDIDRTILLHQAHASQSRQAAEVVLLGDSSCLMDVSATLLAQRLGCGVLNLGTLSYLDLPSAGLLLENYARANPGLPRTVVLLMHPETLRLQEPSGYYSAALQSYYARRDHYQTDTVNGRINQWLGVDILRGRLLARWLPLPLPGRYGERYGFAQDLWRSLDRSQGSALDPNRFDRRRAEGNAEYRLAKRFDLESRQFRAQAPANFRLVVGLTPSPASFVLPNHAETCQRMLVQWGKWLQADLLLTNLPATFPDAYFASVTHLNEAGVAEFTSLLAKHVGPR